MNVVKQLRRHAGITQTELARRAGTSQPAVAAYEAGTKSPSLRTVSRLAAAADCEMFVTFARPLTREERRSIALHRAIAEALQADPMRVLDRARRNLTRMRAQHAGARRLIDLWAALLRLPVPELSDILVDPRPWARELRQVTPFAGVLTAAERARVYRAFAESEEAA